MRVLLALLAAAAATFLIVALSEMLIPAVVRMPALQPHEVMTVASAPLAAKLMVLGGWTLAGAVSAALAVLINRRKAWMAWPGVVFVLVGVGFTLAEIAHPLWMAAGGILLPLLAAAGVQALFRRGARSSVRRA